MSLHPPANIHSLSLDDVFNVMEFLPIKDLGNALCVCREWNSLDQYEPFWKAMLNNFLSSNMVSYFRTCQEICGSDLKISNNSNAQQILGNLKSEDTKKKTMVVAALKSMKCVNKTLMDRMDYQINKSILTMIVNSFETNVLKDKVANRISLRLIKQQEAKKEEQPTTDQEDFFGYVSDEEEKKEELIGGRFKYLLEKQILSIASTTISTFQKRNYTDLFPTLIRILTNKEYSLKNEQAAVDVNSFEFNVMRLLVKFHKKSDTLLAYWKQLIESAIRRLPSEVSKEDFEEIFETLLDRYENTYPSYILGYIFEKFEHFERFLPLLKKYIQKNGIESEFLINNLVSLSGLKISIPQKWELAQIYMDFISDFAPPEITNFPHYFIFDLSNDLEILSTFIDKYPQVLVEDFPFMYFDDFTRQGNAKNFFQVVRSKGVDCSIQIHNLRSSLLSSTRYGCIKHTQTLSELIRFFLDEKIFTDIYQFEEESKFFIRFVEYLMEVHYELVEKEIEYLFPTTIDLSKIYGQDTAYEKRIWNAIGQLVTRLHYVEELPQIKKIMEKFTPTVWNVDLLIFLLEDDSLHYEVISKIYELIRVSDTESLDQYAQRLIKENDSVAQDETSFNDYPRSDPKFYICLYNACKLKFSNNQ